MYIRERIRWISSKTRNGQNLILTLSIKLAPTPRSFKKSEGDFGSMTEKILIVDDDETNLRLLHSGSFRLHYRGDF